jgi:hypothetical protein
MSQPAKTSISLLVPLSIDIFADVARRIGEALTTAKSAKRKSK